MNTIAAPTAGTTVTVRAERKDNTGRVVATKMITGVVAEGFEPDAAGEMLIRVRGALRACNVSEIVAVLDA